MHLGTRVAMTLILFCGATMARGQTPTRGARMRVAPDSSKQRFRWPHFGVALGPGISWQHPTNESSENEISLGFVGGLFRGSQPAPAKAGLIPAFKVFLLPRKTAVVDTLTPATTILGSLKIRPVLVGLGWAQPIAPKLSAALTGTAGYSFNSLGASNHAKHSPRLVVPASPSAIGNSVSWETGLRFWYNVRPTVTVITGVSFLHTRPHVTFADGSGREWNADQLGAVSGVAFTIFRW
jgi:hypothetical protein